MDKNTIYFVLILLVLVLFSGFINEITGKLVAVQETTAPACFDSDGGLNVNVWGSVSSQTMKGIDTCVNERTVNEGYCKKVMYGTAPAFQQIACPTGTSCKNGVCAIPAPITPKTTTTCTDSDNGQNYNVPGTTSAYKYRGMDHGTLTSAVIKTFEDFCCYKDNCYRGPAETSNWLEERWCVGEIAYVTNYKCPNGCRNGACISACQESWTCTSWTPDPSTVCSTQSCTQIRTCTDSNNCGTTTSKPVTSQTVSGTKSCICTESWTCTFWTPTRSTICSGTLFTQIRTCTDSNNCGTTTSKPVTSQTVEGSKLCTCTCTTNGARQCVVSTCDGINTYCSYTICGNYNTADSCLEWKTPAISCGGGYTGCSSGTCTF